jgi:hypothetical protein
VSKADASESKSLQIRVMKKNFSKFLFPNNQFTNRKTAKKFHAIFWAGAPATPSDAR